jgi:hypothetical protein
MFLRTFKKLLHKPFLVGGIFNARPSTSFKDAWLLDSLMSWQKVALERRNGTEKCIQFLTILFKNSTKAYHLPTYPMSLDLMHSTSVADPGCLSRILIITHPGSKNSNWREWWKKISCHTCFVAINFTKL